MASENIKYLKGIGEKRAELFSRLGISSVDALLRFYPRDYHDYKNTVSIYDALPDSVCALKAKLSNMSKPYKIRGNMTVCTLYATDGTGLLKVSIFNSAYLLEKLKIGETYIFYGKITGIRGNRAMSAPEIVEPDGAEIAPIYPLTAGLRQGNVRKAVESALKLIPPDPIPDAVRRKAAVCDLDFALRQIHFPSNYESLKTAKKRLIFEELFLFRMGISMAKRRNSQSSGRVINELYLEDFQRKLPFTLTPSQLKVIAECGADMASGKQMNRLIQGDVGSGKTAIAAALMFAAARAGAQSAFMAPTEILAEQHFATLSRLFEGTEIRLALLTGSTRKGEKDKIKAHLLSGEIDIIIGTHALISQGVEYSSLALVIADEQHRFGVNQRAALVSRGTAPHTLVMSATPIPRTLALILYGELDISTVDAPPSGRLPIMTYSVEPSFHPRLYNFIKKNVSEGRQAYIVCPLVEENDSDITPAVQYYEKLSKSELSGLRLGLLHGKMSPREKDAAMRAFLAGETQVLVSTTVIEVGVDVPNANIIVIENAERFGLSALHQLRGRVGRGAHQSYCVLVSSAQNAEAKERFTTMTSTTDGFKISETDLKMRGPGDFMGNRQHGLPQFRIANLTCDMEELKLAGRAAEWVLSRDPELKNPENTHLRKELSELWKTAKNKIN